MSTQSDALAALAAVEQKLETDELLDEQTITALTAERDSLKAQLAAAPADDTAQLTDLQAKLTELDARIVAEQQAASGQTPPATPPATS